MQPCSTTAFELMIPKAPSRAPAFTTAPGITTVPRPSDAEDATQALRAVTLRNWKPASSIRLVTACRGAGSPT